MYRIAVTSNGLGDANLFQFGQQRTGIGLQATSIVADAGVGQFGFADTQQLGQIAGIFTWVINFRLLITLV
ncbi:hypothetical protein D3C81_2296870 [compost metagenome]